jgi:hypothetical protein
MLGIEYRVDQVNRQERCPLYLTLMGRNGIFEMKKASKSLIIRPRIFFSVLLGKQYMTDVSGEPLDVSSWGVLIMCDVKVQIDDLAI